MADDKKALILRESIAILDARTLLQTPAKDLDPMTQVTAWSVLDLMEEHVIGARKAELRGALFDTAVELGEKNKNGSYKVQLPDGSSVEKRAKKGKIAIDEDKVRELLKLKGIAIEEVFRVPPPKPPAFSPEAFEALAVLGKITKEEVATCATVGEPTYSLYVDKPREVLALLPGRDPEG